LFKLILSQSDRPQGILFTMVEFNPNNQPDQEELRSLFVGKNVNELPTPMAILDRNLIAAHCDKMLAACKALDVKFRPHVKTHKVNT
jgi:hypothetical protein